MAPQLASRRAEWQTLYATRLPDLARTKSSAQKSWPVTLDHCFGRIILDKVVGRGEVPWTQCIRSPAIRTMSDDQVEACIKLGERIASGDVDLVELDEESLAVRGKASKHGGKRKRDNGGEQDTLESTMARSTKTQDDDMPVKKSRLPHESADIASDEPETLSQSQKQSKPLINTSTETSTVLSSHEGQKQPTTTNQKLAAKAMQTDSMAEERRLIRSSELAEYRKKVLLALCQVPKGKFTTYAAISEFLGSSPRAVGNAMRNNPFAPAVPCHRVLAADGKIGGYCGQWGQGDLVKKKIKLLREEGLKFDGKGKVVGGPFKGFQ